jgi:hypothetical protein
MWTFDNFPSKALKAEYGFAPSQAWLDHVERQTLRIVISGAGCTASFISPNGLAMTNHHCVAGCAGQLSTPQHDYAQEGFIAKTAADERTCPDSELDQLRSIRNVTADVRAALAGKTGDAANRALDAEEAKLQASCGTSPAVRCDVVSLYHGGIYDLYRYARFSDLRLVFAPEYAVGQFGGDPDNFNFPRYGYDVGLLRVYENGQPLANADYLRWSANGAKAGQLVFVPGNPGGTSRELTSAQLAFERDRALPAEIPENAEYRGQLEAFVGRGPEQAREANELLAGIANDYKELIGFQQMLNDPHFFATKQRDEAALRAKAKVGAFAEIARIQTVRGELFERQLATNDLFMSRLMRNALSLVRAAAERPKPNGQRLPEYTDQNLVAVERRLTSPIPVYKDLDTLQLTLALTYVQRDLGPDDPFVHKLLGTESPEVVAGRLVAQTHLDDRTVRAELYHGGQAAIAASTDPMIRFVVAIDPDLRAVRKAEETRVEAPTRTAAEQIAKARFAVYGTSVYPDATFSPRINFGTIKGFSDLQGHTFAPYTTFAGLYARANGFPPYALPQSWLDAKGALDLSMPLNFSSSNDIIGGNSGSPVLDTNADIVGLAFDGNIFSLGGDYGYDPVRNRMVSVDSRALLAGWRTVYHFDRIVNEIEAARKAGG